MTIKELKEIIKDVPEDWEVKIEDLTWNLLDIEDTIVNKEDHELLLVL